MSSEENAPLLPSTKAKEPATSSPQPESQAVINARDIAILGGGFSIVNGHQISVVLNINDSTSASTSKTSVSPSAPLPSNETDRTNPSPPSDGQSNELNRNQSQVPSQNQEIPLQKSYDIYERHLKLKERGIPLWIPEPNRRLHISYRRTGIRIGDVGIITHSGAFSFLFNICLPRDDPVNPRMLPEHFAPIWPPIDDDIDEFPVFDSYLASASITRSQSSSDFSRIVFESSASEGAILTIPQGARSEDLGNVARFREYTAANVADWYKFVNGPRGREAKNGDIRLVVGFDKTKSWGIATFVNQTIQKNSLKFGPLEGTGSATYRWEYSGVVEARIGPASSQNDKLKMASDPPDVQFENQSLFVRTLNTTLPEAVWKDLNSNLGSVPADPANDQSHHPPNSNHPHPSHSGNGSGSNSSAPQGGQYGTQRTECSVHELQDTSDDNPLISGPLESFTAHPSRVLNDILLAKNPTAKMVITHDNDWSSLIEENGTLPDSHDLIANVLAPRVREENGVVFLQPLPRKGRPNDTSPTSAGSPVLAVYESKATADLAEKKAPSTKYSVGRTMRLIPPSRDSLDSVLTLPEYCRNPPHSHSKEGPPLYTLTLVEEPTSIDLPSKSDIIIAVMGPTGAGKSTFINKAAGIEVVEVGHGLVSCTNEIQTVRCVDKQNRQVVFVDTPGFDDTNISDLDILQRVAEWLTRTYEKGICLSGLLFFHRISDNRMAGSPLKHLTMFQNLCGKEALKNVMLVTTMWDDVEEREGRNHEIELSTKYWNDMLKFGSRTARFDNDAESAWKIVSQFQEAPCAVLLQKELVDQRLKLAETAAGAPLFSWLSDFITRIELRLKQNQHSDKKAVEAKLRDAKRRLWRFGS